MIEIELDDGEFRMALTRIAEALADMTPVMQDIGELMVYSTKSRFLAGEAPDGTPWAPKSQTTRDSYARRRDPIDDRPLFGPSRRLSSEIHYSAGSEGVEWGSSLIYAATQHFGAARGSFGTTRRGGAIPWGDIPARPFLGLSEGDRADVLDTVNSWLERVARGRG